MKAIATVNFKGGVGKTTVSWLLAKYVAEERDKRVLVIDADAQMSLTLAVSLQETGAMRGEYQKWEDRQKGQDKTLFKALDKYEKMSGGHFDFPIDASFIYEVGPNLHFVPSTIDLYWLEMDVFDREKSKGFVSALLGKIEHSKIGPYDYVFFDCPPNFTVLSYSVLNCCSMILVPVNPDVFAARGVGLMIEGLQGRIQPWPNPCMGVFMNKAKLYRRKLTQESQRYWDETKLACKAESARGVGVRAFESFIPERVDIKRAIPGRTFPSEFAPEFAALWDNIEETLE